MQFSEIGVNITQGDFMVYAIILFIMSLFCFFRATGINPESSIHQVYQGAWFIASAVLFVGACLAELLADIKKLLKNKKDDLYQSSELK